MKNVLTFDVEEYFHAEAFAGVVRPGSTARRSAAAWSTLPNASSTS
jgi:hypothetical protein